MTLSSWRRRSRAAAFAIVIAVPQTAIGQDDAYAHLSASITETYDSNLFAVPASRAPRGDLVSRVGPALDVGYVSVPLTVVASYGMAAERYVNLAELNRDLARQDAAMTLRYLPARRLRLDIDTSYAQTQAPGEFNRDSGLAVGRARAERGTAGAHASFQWSPVTELAVGHVFEHDALAGGVASSAHRVLAGVQHRTGRRNSYRANYEFRRIGFSEGAPEDSSVVTGGWVRALTERTTLELTAGPRIGPGAIRPELSAALRRRLSLGELSAGYSRSEMTAIGERGTIDVHRLVATGTYRPVRRLTLAATPAFARSTRNDLHVPVYTLDVEGVFDATRQWSFAATGRFGHQQGTFGEIREEIPYRSVALKVVVRLAPARAASPGPVS